MKSQKVLIMGLPGTGKTSLAKELAPLLQAVHFDGDEIRKNVNAELGFSEHDRIEQARRMGWLCDKVVEAGHNAIASFICPTVATRRAFGQAYTIWMDTEDKSKYKDTNQIFQKPYLPDYTVDSKKLTPFETACKIRDIFFPNIPFSLFIGRWQPLHEGHIKLISTAITEGKRVVVGIRDTPISPENPFTIADRKIMIQKAFHGWVDTIVVPDIEEICIGRKVGYGIREIVLPEETQKISGTETRKEIFC